MASWVTHLMIADKVLMTIPELDRHCFCVGNIAPDCNVENEDWTQFTPSREITHWMSANKKTEADCNRFFDEYIKKRKQEINSAHEFSFLLGYYSHLIVDAEFQSFIRDPQRVSTAWKRIKAHPTLSNASIGMPENWDSIKILIDKKDRLKDIYSIEAKYLKSNPHSGYLTEIMGLKSFPDYIDYLPNGAIARKIGIMGYLPEIAPGMYPFIAVNEVEYSVFITQATEKIINNLNDRIGEFLL